MNRERDNRFRNRQSWRDLEKEATGSETDSHGETQRKRQQVQKQIVMERPRERDNRFRNRQSWRDLEKETTGSETDSH